MFGIHEKRAERLMGMQILLFLCAGIAMIPLGNVLGLKPLGICAIETVIVVAFIFSLSTVILFLRQQERRLEEATKCVNRFMNGDSTVRLLSYEEGAMAKFFEEINHMSLSLHTHLEAEKESKEFLKTTISDISHQLKTPIAAIRMYNEIMAGESERPETVRNFTKKTEKSLDRMECLIQNLLKITKLDAGTIVLEKRMFEVEPFLDEICEEFMTVAEAESKKVILNTNQGNGERQGVDVIVHADWNWTAECVRNLIQNALDHMEHGDTVEVSYVKTPVFLRISVKDNGSGIHPEDIHHIFKRFYRSRFSKSTQGVGLGLALVKAIMEAHGGTVMVESTMGEGSTFSLDFPNE